MSRAPVPPWRVHYHEGVKRSKSHEAPTGRAGRAVSRRTILASAAGVLGARAIGARAQTPPADPTKVQGTPTSELGARSEFETPKRRHAATFSYTPHQDLHGTITPADLHYERHHAGVPTIDPRTYSLLVHGMVDRPLVFTLADLKRFTSVSYIRFLECSGNYLRNAPETTKPDQIAGMTSTTEWTGVPLSVVMREVGVHKQATWFLAEGGDAAVLTRSVPVEKALDDAILAYAQNGEALRPAKAIPFACSFPGGKAT